MVPIDSFGAQDHLTLLAVTQLSSGTMPTCFVPGCTSGYKSNPEKRHFFAPPSDPQLLGRWVRAIPRADKPLSKTCKVCDVHFVQGDIVKTYKHVIDGQIVEMDRGCWALKPDAVPCQFPNVPSHLSRNRKRRRSPKKRPSVPTNADPAIATLAESQQEVPETADSVQSIDFAQIVEKSASMRLPKNWRMAALEDEAGKHREVVFYDAGMKGGVYAILKSVVIREDLTYVVQANGKLLHKWDADIQIFSVEDIEAILQIVHTKQFCRGCSRVDVANSRNAAQNARGTLYHKDCAILTNADKDVCAVCTNLAKCLKRRTTSARSNKKVPVAASVLRKRLIRATAARERKKRDVKRLSEELKTALTRTLDEITEDLPEVQKMALRTAVMQQAAKSPRGHRYTADWLMVCLLLRLTSPKGYKALSSMKVLPLPSTCRLVQLLRGLPCEYGLNKFALESIQLQMTGKPEHQTYGCIIIDEVKLREATEFNRTSCKFDGFINYGDVAKADGGQLADHALVIMFNPMFDSWVQPIASYATKGAAPGWVLAKMVVNSVLQLQQHGAHVLAVISDGAGNNKSMWKHLGVSGKLGEAQCKIDHPCLPDGAFLHFICDMPHVIKCVRNHLMKHKYGEVSYNQAFL